MNPYLEMLRNSDTPLATPLTVLTKAPSVSTVSMPDRGRGEISALTEGTQHEPSVSKVSKPDGGMQEIPAPAQAAGRHPSVSTVSTPSRGIQHFLPPGVFARLAALVQARRLTYAQAEEVQERYWTNPDVWETKLLTAERSAGLLACHRCAAYRTPGLTGPYDGYCAGREDLPPAYGPDHPLRLLPKDGGHGCPVRQDGARWR